MYINHLAGFRSFIEETQPQMFTTTVTRDYLGQNFYWDGSSFPITNPGGVAVTDSMGGKRTLQAGTFIGVEPEFAKNLKGEPKPNQKVPIAIGNAADPDKPTQSNTAHGKPSQYGGQSFTVPYSTFIWMIQPPSAAGGGMGGMTGGMGGGMPPAGGPMGAPPGGMGGMPPGAPPAPGGPPPM